ncbi:MAG: hypothetical protein SFT81_04630 [Candidatus Caenarcaniphilales bacterium]|nr:hypothetical protein [Candidatus Caenarcaniphilales bacterium]
MKYVLLIAFLGCLALQGLRSLVVQAWHFTKSYMQLSDLRRAEKKVIRENDQMLREVRRLKDSPFFAQLKHDYHELNKLKDPAGEIVAGLNTQEVTHPAEL